MDDAEFASVLAAAEAGGASYPETGSTGLLAEAERLNRAEGFVFAEAQGFDDFFNQLTACPAGSPLLPRAERLRLLRKNRATLREVLEAGDKEIVGAMFSALAAGPGPTYAKRRFVAFTVEQGRVNSVSDLRRALSEKAGRIYLAERAWLKKVGPSRAVTRWQKFVAGMPEFNAGGILKALAIMLAIGVALAGGPVGIGILLYFIFRKKDRA